jgi:hypothetical protein
VTSSTPLGAVALVPVLVTENAVISLPGTRPRNVVDHR